MMSQGLNNKKQINLVKKGEIVLVKLPDANSNSQNTNQWQRMIDNFKIRLQKVDRSWVFGTKVWLESLDTLLDTRQLNELENILEQVGLIIDTIVTHRRQTAVAAASAGYSVKQEYSLLKGDKIPDSEITQELAEPLYLKKTIRSGVEIYHSGSVIVVGDVNPGANIIASGDILVWGDLKGIAHAGAMGNHQAVIMSLKMQPTQLRIAENVARAPSHPPDEYTAEIAYISEEGIKIHVASNFYRYYDFISTQNCWQMKNKAKFKL